MTSSPLLLYEGGDDLGAYGFKEDARLVEIVIDLSGGHIQLRFPNLHP
jgi:hypothetical protein